MPILHSQMSQPVHRDVKPANILIDGAGRACLTDFDLVRAVDSSAGTRIGSMLGTRAYAAPELMVNGQDACGVSRQERDRGLAPRLASGGSCRPELMEF